VGKTFAMLQAVRDRATEGVSVLAAVVETHGRAKLGDDGADPRWIFTEPGVGYRLADR